MARRRDGGVRPRKPIRSDLRELAIHPDHRHRGYGRQIHDALLRGRPEPLAGALVRHDDEPATAACIAWGWRRIGRHQQSPDSSALHVMIRPL
jgi:ribosomal protein S18 acetylase RimI-like enzyme